MNAKNRSEKDAGALSALEVAKQLGLRFAELRILAHDVLHKDVRANTWIGPADQAKLSGAYDAMLSYEPAISVHDDDGMPSVEFCPVCFDPIDYCRGHGEIGDSVGYAIQKEIDDNE